MARQTDPDRVPGGAARLCQRWVDVALDTEERDGLLARLPGAEPTGMGSSAGG
ncbi:MAG: hypothetical protein U5R31_06000 [Acidimicrobiia bacterium]|nr:hypothetical protein [Acidimicrobiia bacterium]